MNVTEIIEAFVRGDIPAPSITKICAVLALAVIVVSIGTCILDKIADLITED